MSEDSKCRFMNCKWSGVDIFSHCQIYHKHCIKKIRKDRIGFTFENIDKETFLLCGNDGIYWFCLDSSSKAMASGLTKSSAYAYRRGIFGIGQSKPMQYTVKFGSRKDGRTEYYGPYKTRSEDSKRYDLKISFKLIKILINEMPSRKITIFFEDCEDSNSQYVDTTVKQDEIEQLYMNCLETFECCICIENIQENARFCDNEHFICEPCFTALYYRKQLQCPICSSLFPLDCVNEEIEKLLKLVNWPDTDSPIKKKKKCDTNKDSKFCLEIS